MQIITVESSAITPSIKFDASQGKLAIKGVSVPENAVDFYKTLTESLEQYASNPKPVTVVDILLEYCNTASTRCLLTILRCLEGIHRKGNEVTINWYYEEDDEDMRDAGEDYQSIVKLAFNIQQAKTD